MSTLVMERVAVAEVDQKKVKAEKKEFCKNIALTRLGETKINSLGSKMFIVNYTDSTNVDVQFENGYIATNITYNQFKLGTVKNPYDKSVFGVGYIGEGKYKVTDENGNITPQYKTWSAMFQRCYSKSYQRKQPSYIGCSVCDEWHNFQNFGKFYDANYYNIGNSKMSLDKDLLVPNNKIYSEKNCVFVPSFINNLILKRDAKRGNLPLGVIFRKANNKYQSQCSDGFKLHHIGYFSTPEEGFSAYKKYKENHIKEIADEYKNQIPKKLYDALSVALH